jgi:hypothetical protein
MPHESTDREGQTWCMSATGSKKLILCYFLLLPFLFDLNDKHDKFSVFST